MDRIKVKFNALPAFRQPLVATAVVQSELFRVCNALTLNANFKLPNKKMQNSFLIFLIVFHVKLGYNQVIIGFSHLIISNQS